MTLVRSEVLQRLKYADEAGLLPQGLILAVYHETKLPLKSAEILLQDGLQEWSSHTMFKPLLTCSFCTGLRQAPITIKGVIHCLLQSALDHAPTRSDFAEVNEGTQVWKEVGFRIFKKWWTLIALGGKKDTVIRNTRSQIRLDSYVSIDLNCCTMLVFQHKIHGMFFRIGHLPTPCIDQCLSY